MGTDNPAMPPLVLVGGSFNPPHIGHLRIAIAASEALSPAMTLFIPCASPPHKNSENLLPFDLRASMLRAALDEAGMDKSFAVCEVENERVGPSYTADTLAVLAGRCSGGRLAFVLGAEDYAQLPAWRRWREIPGLADLAVLPRGDRGREAFAETTRTLWPEARKTRPPSSAVGEAFALPGGGQAFFLPQPLLGISSTLLRELWLEGRRLDFLVPRAVRKLLSEHEQMIRGVWNFFPH